MSEKFLFRAKEACVFLSISKSFLYQLIADGYLPSGRRLQGKQYVVWTKADLESFINQHLTAEVKNG